MNTVSLIGYLGSDPELKYTASGTPVTTLSLAVHETWKDEQGEKKEHTNWVKAVAWNRLAEIAGEYLNKGDRVAVVGSLRQRTYEDNSGNNRSVLEVVVRNMDMLSAKGNDNGKDDFPKSAESDSIPF